VQTYAADVTPQVASKGTDSTATRGCKDGKRRMVHTIPLDVPPPQQDEILAKYAAYWRANSRDTLTVLPDRVMVSSSISDWSTRVERQDGQLLLIGQTACIPRDPVK
jgi:hypothetical protein